MWILHKLFYMPQASEWHDGNWFSCLLRWSVLLAKWPVIGVRSYLNFMQWWTKNETHFKPDVIFIHSINPNKVTKRVVSLFLYCLQVSLRICDIQCQFSEKKDGNNELIVPLHLYSWPFSTNTDHFCDRTTGTQVWTDRVLN